MQTLPTLNDVRSYAQTKRYHRVPLYCELYADATTPIEVLRHIRSQSSHCFMLESAEQDAHIGRYTFLGYNPRLCVSAKDGITTIRKGEETTTYQDRTPAEVIRSIIAAHRSPRIEGLPPFSGGLMGYFSYSYLATVDDALTINAPGEEAFQDVDLMLFDRLIAFDTYRQKIILIAHVDLDAIGDKPDGLESAYHVAVQELGKMRAFVTNHHSEEVSTSGRITSPIRELMDKETYCDVVRKVQEHIYAGDIFQAVPSNRLEANFEGTLLDTYRVLRTINPSPYMFFLSSNQLELAGASPETLIRLQDGTLHTYPLAGTRPRGADIAEDRKLEAELLADEKELAEHNMLVDLGRNDIGKLSTFGSVHVDRHCYIERYSHVMHLCSAISGTIRPEYDAVDAIGAALPAGTLSGAPKIRACQILDELEGCRRGIYGGAVGYLDFTGNLDMCIAIRLAYHTGGKVYVRAGAGIVADSDPESEYEESRNKARAVVEALEIAQKGLDA
ncbi:MAG: anthranilate synthase component I family protein [Eggerthellaceae bacterium]|nr:anthranilate synthase component I family protein [Eggerthellaceae bacterium]MCH4220653.1 anthranilate synthase component I family protein [Eggerthellaceae bacterium]